MHARVPCTGRPPAGMYCSKAPPQEAAACGPPCTAVSDSTRPVPLLRSRARLAERADIRPGDVRRGGKALAAHARLHARHGRAKVGRADGQARQVARRQRRAPPPRRARSRPVFGRARGQRGARAAGLCSLRGARVRLVAGLQGACLHVGDCRKRNLPLTVPVAHSAAITGWR